MRFCATLLAVGLGFTAAAIAAPPFKVLTPEEAKAEATAQWAYKYKSLDRPDALANLQSTNPLHYGIVRKILAAASEICDAAADGPIPVKFEARDVSCASGLWMASNPPKRSLQFRIDDTVYTALVAVVLKDARLKPAH